MMEMFLFARATKGPEVSEVVFSWFWPLRDNDRLLRKPLLIDANILVPRTRAAKNMPGQKYALFDVVCLSWTFVRLRWVFGAPFGHMFSLCFFWCWAHVGKMLGKYWAEIADVKVWVHKKAR